MRSLGAALFTVSLFSFIALSVSAKPKPPVVMPNEGQVNFGVQLDWSHDSIDSYSKRLGRTPKIFGHYVQYPLSSSDLESVNSEVKSAGQHGAMYMLTLEPWPGLHSVNSSNLRELTKHLKSWNSQGVPIVVRFAHEMNGSWYPWAQQPTNYISTFRKVASAVHQAPLSTMLWSPNDGGGYPVAGGPYEAKPNTDDFRILDTNKDGKLSMFDDPYTPYYPGDSYVDWVGLSLYHFGSSYPWGENEIPTPNKFKQKLTGTYKTTELDETPVPNFYALFADGHNKPFVLSETGALYNSSRADGASNFDIKSEWWQQLFDPTLAVQFPRLKMMLWFEYQKQEKDTGEAIIDWRVTKDRLILDAFKASIPNRFLFAE